MDEFTVQSTKTVGETGLRSLLIAVWTRPGLKLASLGKAQSSKFIKAGGWDWIKAVAGEKGALQVRLQVLGFPVLVLCSAHLPFHKNAADQGYSARVQFFKKFAKTIKTAEVAILAGDLNFRIRSSMADIKIMHQNSLLGDVSNRRAFYAMYDELTKALSELKWFEGPDDQGAASLPFTCKFAKPSKCDKTGSDKYWRLSKSKCMKIRGQEGKPRIPSVCDRIVSNRPGLNMHYETVDMNRADFFSDHLAVFGVFSIDKTV